MADVQREMPIYVPWTRGYRQRRHIPTILEYDCVVFRRQDIVVVGSTDWLVHAYIIRTHGRHQPPRLLATGSI
jgi:hypothetical protein